MADDTRRLRRNWLLVGAVVIVIVGATFAWWRFKPTQATPSTTSLCDELVAAQGLDQAIVSLDPASLRADADALRNAAKIAPADIAPQLTELSTFVDEIVKEVQAASGNKRTALSDALAARQGRVDAITADGRAVQQWASSNCGIQLVTSTTIKPATTTTARPAPSSTTAPTTVPTTNASTTTTTRR